MNIIERLNAQIEQLLNDYKTLKYENEALKAELDDMKNNTDEIQRTSQDMLLNIDRALTLTQKLNKKDQSE
jgi:cell division protein FtsB